MDFKNKVIALVGPTGVGKTELSLELASLINAEIISCDSMQIYRGMDIGTAKATREERQRVSHHLVDIKNFDEPYSVCEYVADAKKALEIIFSKGKNALVVGGTGLYADSFIKDTDFDSEASDAGIRRELELFAQKNGSEALFGILKKIDPKSAETIHSNNVKRVIRAIEYYRVTGETIYSHNEKTKLKKSPYDYVYIGLTRDRSELYDRINKRVDLMMKEGLADEVFSLWKKGCSLSMTSMQALGYKELIHYIEGRCTLGEAVEILKRDSRRYAKRQLTWFKRNGEINWINLSWENGESPLSQAKEILLKKFM